MLPSVSFTIDDHPVLLDDGWSFNAIRNGGYDQFRGKGRTDAIRGIDNIGQGSVIKAFCDGRLEAIWEGRLSAIPRYAPDGSAEIAARGYFHDADKRVQRRLYQSTDMEKWVPANAEPFVDADGDPVLDHYKKIDLEASTGKMEWRLENQNYTAAASNRAGFGFYAADCTVQEIVFRLNSSDGTGTNDFELQYMYGTDPTSGSLTKQTETTTSTGNMGTTKTISISAPAPVIVIYLRCQTTSTPLGDKFKFNLTKMRVCGVTNAAMYKPSEVMADIAGQMDWDAALITTSTDLTNVLPLDWEGGSWAELLTYVANMEDWAWAVLDDQGGGPRIRYQPYDTEVWTVHQSKDATADLTPMEVFNRVRVNYQSNAGVPMSVSADATPDPLAASGLTNEYLLTLNDPQPDDVLPTAVAVLLVDRLATQRYSGRVDVGHAVNSLGEDDPRRILPGDTLYLADWDSGSGMNLRVAGVEQSSTGVSVTTEDWLGTESLIAQFAFGMAGGVKGGRPPPTGGPR